MNKIPKQLESPNGLHQRYQIRKIIKRPNEFMGFPLDPEYSLDIVDVDPGSEYFVLRLDEDGKDREHIKACRIGIHAYATAIEHHLPELAKDLRERYPLL